LEKLLYVGGVLGSGEVQVSHQLVGMVIWILSWLLSVVRPHGGSRVLLGTHGDVLISIVSLTARPLVANAEKIQPANNNNNNPPIEICVCVCQETGDIPGEL
jgi:hypothetical protein